MAHWRERLDSVWAQVLNPGASARIRSEHKSSHRKFMHPNCLRVHKVSNFFQEQVAVKCPHHLWLSPSLKLHSFLSETIIHRSPPLPKIWRQKTTSKPLNYLSGENWLTYDMLRRAPSRLEMKPDTRIQSPFHCNRPWPRCPSCPLCTYGTEPTH